MPVNSAEELHDLIVTLSDQFDLIHRPAANHLWSQADAHLEHAVSEAGSWLTAELSHLVGDWHIHKCGLQDAEQWFAHHAPLLRRIAEDPVKLAREAFSVGGLGQGSVSGLLAGVSTTMPWAKQIAKHAYEAFDSGVHGLATGARLLERKGVSHVSGYINRFGTQVEDYNRWARGIGKSWVTRLTPTVEDLDKRFGQLEVLKKYTGPIGAGISFVDDGVQEWNKDGSPGISWEQRVVRSVAVGGGGALGSLVGGGVGDFLGGAGGAALGGIGSIEVGGVPGAVVGGAVGAFAGSAAGSTYGEDLGQGMAHFIIDHTPSFFVGKAFT